MSAAVPIQSSAEPRQLPPPAPAAPQRLELFKTGLAVLQAVLIAGFAWVLKDRLDMALKERQTQVQELQAQLQVRKATVETLEKMDRLLKAINDPTTEEVERARAVAQMSMYGSDAVFPAFVMAVGRSPVSPENAEWVLRVLAVQNRAEVCALLLGAQKVPDLIVETRKKRMRGLMEELACTQTEPAS
jgi:hypothetical protein